ncbi:hypothetical protein [Aureimonas populi]|uniref:Lipoprotein n=1 Tax=Aureimonas populi TaxID=1701758 RepID=A0ABW5CRW5_9HYPH|nr:hypothetical protein [Aureimonas populi]
MPLHKRSRLALLFSALAALSACSTTGEEAAPQLAAAPAQIEGTEARFCPQVTLREGTSILRRGEGDAQQFVASIAETTRSCRVVNGELLMEVGVSGRLVPGMAARGGSVELPVRVAVSRGADVLYSNLGRVSVSTAPGPAQTFVYVDRAVRIPEPTSRGVSIFIGFDDQAR